MSGLFLRVLSVFAILLAAASPSYGQSTNEKVILVLDGSGSMWGQIDGEAKITIAQRVIGDLLETLPENQQLGLTAYGHREKGNCQDIETLVMPGTDTRQAILGAVNAISPKGKTPLSAAVIAAAQQLRFEEDKATVILISDGIETCDLDPCMVGTQLEQTGVDFTAHVVGFDVSDPIAIAQLQCLAENTGGSFIKASNANELAQALVEVSVQEKPEPVVIEITVNARDGANGPIVDGNLVWTLRNTSLGEIVTENTFAPQIFQELEEGNYTAEVLRTSDEAVAELSFSVTKSGTKTFTLTLPPTLPDASIDVASSAVAGSTIPVSWTGPAGENDFMAIAEVGSTETDYVNFTYVAEGHILELLMPPQPGTYELRYVFRDQSVVLAAEKIFVTEVLAELVAPKTAVAGQELIVQWEGPNYRDDYISVAKAGSADEEYVNYTYTREGVPLSLEMPADPGQYELRYVMKQGKTILARQSINIDPVGATIIVPKMADAGQDLIIQWEGPNYRDDYIAVSQIGSADGKYVNYTYTREGNTLTLEMPSAAGTYEIRYVQKQDKTVLAKQEIELTPVSASMTAPTNADAGSQIVVQWEGPNYRDDYISIAPVGAADNKYSEYTYSREGSPLQLQLPGIPGIYELRYVQKQDHTVLTRQEIIVNGITASLTAPSRGAPEASISVQWTGPGYHKDYISIAKAGTADNKYESYEYVRAGSPLIVKLPEEPGDYELRYVMRQDTQVLARMTIHVGE